MAGFDRDDETPSSKRRKGPFAKLAKSPSMQLAMAGAPRVLSAEDAAHKFFWFLLLHDAGPNPFHPEGRLMTAPDGWS